MWTNLSGQSSTYPLVEYVYNGFGEVKQVKTYAEAEGTARDTEYTCDKNGRVTAIDHPSPLGDESFGYDDVGNLWWKVDGEGAVTLYKYDDLNRLTHAYYNYTGNLPPTSYPGSADVTYEYDGGSRLRTSMTDPHSTRATTYSYDIFDRLEFYTPATPRTDNYPDPDTNVRTIKYTYNNLNQKTRMELYLDYEDQYSTPEHVVDYAYFKNGWLKNVQWDSGTIAEYTYDAIGYRARVDYAANDTYYTYAYQSDDPRYLVSGITHWKKGTPDTELLEITYPERDGAGNPERIVIGTAETSYVYDNRSRLWKTTYPGESQITFSYDWIGNRLNVPPDTNTLEYDYADQLTRWPNHHQYDYYDTGNLSSQWDDGTNMQKHYVYTDADLLSSVTHYDVQGDPVSEMEWDASGNRVSFTSSTGGTYDFVYDMTSGIPAVIEEDKPLGTLYYIREPDGSLIARASGTTGTVLRYYHFDNLGSTRMLTNGDGDVTDAYTYDAWGKLTGHSEYTGSVDQPYMFVGQLGYYSYYQDVNLFDEGGQQRLQLGVRLYDPDTGRFVALDPAHDGLNWYGYANMNPIGMGDPSGLACTLIGTQPAGSFWTAWQRYQFKFWQYLDYHHSSWEHGMLGGYLGTCFCHWYPSITTAERRQKINQYLNTYSCTTTDKCGKTNRWQRGELDFVPTGEYENRNISKPQPPLASSCYDIPGLQTTKGWLDVDEKRREFCHCDPPKGDP